MVGVEKMYIITLWYVFMNNIELLVNNLKEISNTFHFKW